MTAKTRILFVDDEAAVLAAIERLLRKDQQRWEMVFALGGQKGLDEIRKQCFSVVVSDFRMPQIDGVTVLNEVGAVCPRASQIMLSGDAEAHVMSREVPALHRLIMKPCDATTLRAALERAVDAAQGCR